IAAPSERTAAPVRGRLPRQFRNAALSQTRPIPTPRYATRRLENSCPTSDLGVAGCLIKLGIFRVSSAEQMPHSHRLTRVGREKGSVECNVADVSAGNRQPAQPFVVKVVRRSIRGKDPAPDLGSMLGIREREWNDEPNPAQESSVQSLLHICGKDRQPPVGLHSL